MALLAGSMCGVRNDSCSDKHEYARTSHGMASESLPRRVALFSAQEFCFFKQEHGPPRGSKEVKTDVLLTTVLGPLRRHPLGLARIVIILSCRVAKGTGPPFAGLVPRPRCNRRVHDTFFIAFVAYLCSQLAIGHE